MIVGNRDPYRHTTQVKTIGWQPTCNCNAGESVPCRVLDPFVGSGTTGIVACRLGLEFVGIDQSPEYAKMARRRIRNDAPLFNSAAAKE